jgi:hypothetical protein
MTRIERAGGGMNGFGNELCVSGEAEEGGDKVLSYIYISKGGLI